MTATSNPRGEDVLFSGRLGRLHAALHRHRYVLAPLSFGAGVASFLLVQRKEWIAQWLAVFLLATWLLSVAEVVAPRRLRVPPGLMRFITQQTHQEAFFFTLPFLLRTTSWHTGQALFTGGVIVAALSSMWDPIYFGQIAARRWLYLAFHALAVYLVMLVALPLLLHITTAQTLDLSAAAIGLLAAPGLAHAIDRERASHWLALFAATATVAALAWFARPWIPAATLWVSDSAISLSMDAAQRTPGAIATMVDPRALASDGVYAYTAIKAPRGLREQVYHRWLHRGHEVTRVALSIVGGGADGYRAWSHKTGFPTDPLGSWVVQVITEGGQLIGEARFEVAAGSAEQPADQAPVAEHREAPGDQQPDAGADHEVPVPPNVAAPDEKQSGGEREQSPQGEQVNPAVVPGAQRLDEQGRSRDEVHGGEPHATEPAVGDGALGPRKLDDTQQHRDDSRNQMQPDDRGDVTPGHEAPPSPAP